MKNDRQTLRASKWHDYFSPGFYMLTMVTTERRPLLGTLVGSCAEDAHVELSALGESVLETIMRTGEDFPEVEVVAQTILPDHIHVLLQVKNNMQHHLGEVVKTWKNQTTKCYLHHENHRTLMLNVTEQYEPREHARQQERLAALQLWLKNWDGQGRVTEHDTLSSLQEEALWVMALRESGCAGGDGGRLSRPQLGPRDQREQQGACDQREQQGARDQREQQGAPDGDRLPVRTVPPLWEKGYHDRIVRHNGQIARLKRYIARNPGRLWSKRHAERRLVEVHEVRVMLPIEAAQQLKDMAVWFDQRRTLQAGAMAHQDAALTSYVELMRQCLRRGADGGTPFLRFYGCGNDELLDMGRPLMQLRVSRSVPEGEFKKVVDEVIKRCEEEETIVISPFLSWSEKEVLRLLRSRGYGHIVIRGEEMSQVWKPSDTPSTNHQQQMPEWYQASPMYRELNAMATPSDFDLTLEGLLLTLAPWPQRRRGLHLMKPDMELMNGMARAIATLDSSEG